MLLNIAYLRGLLNKQWENIFMVFDGIMDHRDAYLNLSLDTSTYKVIMFHFRERILNFENTYYMELFNETDRDPDLGHSIHPLLTYINKNYLKNLEEILDLFQKDYISK